MPTLDLSTKGSFVIYQQAILESHLKNSGDRSKKVKWTKDGEKSKASTINKSDLKNTATPSEA